MRLLGSVLAITIAGTAWGPSAVAAGVAPRDDGIKQPPDGPSRGPKTAPRKDIKIPPDYDPADPAEAPRGDIKHPGELPNDSPTSSPIAPITAEEGKSTVLPPQVRAVPRAVPSGPSSTSEPVADRSRRDRLAGIITMGVGGAVAVVGFSLTGYYGVNARRAGNDRDVATLQRAALGCSMNASNGGCQAAQAVLDDARARRHRYTDAVTVSAFVGSIGAAAAIIGVVRYATAVEREKTRDDARVRIEPTLAGLSVRGRF